MKEVPKTGKMQTKYLSPDKEEKALQAAFNENIWDKNNKGNF